MKKICIFLLALTVLPLTLVACQKSPSQSPVNPNLQSKAVNAKTLISINSLLVAPVQFDSTVATSVPANLDVNEMLSKAVNEELQIKVVRSPVIRAKNAGAAISDGNVKLQDQYIGDAKKLKLDGVLITRLTNFNMREGSAVGSTAPARVDLSMQIVNDENNVVWQSTYHFHDQALSDNFFKIKQRLAENQTKFRSAEEILAEGYSSALKDFSQKRLAGFVR